jgi:hypothetical protein
MVNLDSYIDSKGITFLHRIIDEPRKIVDVIRDIVTMAYLKSFYIFLSPRWYFIKFLFYIASNCIRGAMVCVHASKQQSADKHVAPLGHIILIPSQSVIALYP